MGSAWSDYIPRSYVPEQSEVFFGADPAHSPALEDSAPDACPRCGTRGRADDPVRTYLVHVTSHGTSRRNPSALRESPLTVACGLCRRSSFDGTPALWEATKRTLDDREPYRDGARSDGSDRTGEAVRRPENRRRGPLSGPLASRGTANL